MTPLGDAGEKSLRQPGRYVFFDWVCGPRSTRHIRRIPTLGGVRSVMGRESETVSSNVSYSSSVPVSGRRIATGSFFGIGSMAGFAGMTGRTSSLLYRFPCRVRWQSTGRYMKWPTDLASLMSASVRMPVCARWRDSGLLLSNVVTGWRT